jgi:hypothetical protein
MTGQGAAALQGLDKDVPPAPELAKRMLEAIGGHWWNVYIGGPEAGHAWTPNDVAAYVNHGITQFMLTYVGRQKAGPLTRAQGQADGQAAMNLLRSFGYAGRVPMCLDVELGTFESAPAASAEYARAWCETVAQAGARPGLYANPETLKAMHGNVPAEFVWIASWVSHDHGPHDPHSAVGVPGDQWSKPGQRAWQYAGIVGNKPCQVLGVDVDIDVADPGCLAPAPGVTPPGHSNGHPPPFVGRVLTVGMSGDDVQRWQKRMRERGWHLAVSGNYDAASESICQAFQSEKHLTVTGQVDRRTWDATWSAPVTP